jgi:hypothetical protein
VASCLLSLGLFACGADDGTVCDAASKHIDTCLGTATSGSGTCDDRNAKLASELLALDCSGLQSLLANASAAGKADEDCFAPWDCPEKYPPADEACGLFDMARCQGYCDDLYADDHMRLRKVSCELLEGGIAHCKCEGYWLPWPEKKDESPPPDEPEEP